MWLLTLESIEQPVAPPVVIFGGSSYLINSLMTSDKAKHIHSPLLDSKSNGEWM
jgi:hypothetical protein